MGIQESILIGADAREAATLAAECVCKALSGGWTSKSVCEQWDNHTSRDRQGAVGPGAQQPLPDGRGSDTADHIASQTIALSGGTTPVTLYAALAQPPYRDRIDWHRVEWFWSDERAVPPDHPDSNYRLAHAKLLKPLGVSGERIHRMPADAEDLSRAACDYEQLIRHIVPANEAGIPLFDLVLLGIGTDGHTASLFPGSTALAEQNRLVLACQMPGSNAWRMTMTYPLLRAARQIVFFATGAGKAPILARIFSQEVVPAELPAAGLRDADAQVTWILDADAARLVPREKPA